jgi:hypothetical protein
MPGRSRCARPEHHIVGYPSVPFAVMADSGISESVDPQGGPSATVKFKVLWENHYQFVRDLIGTSVASGAAIVRTVPFQYPASPNLYCLSIPSIEGHGKPFLSSFFPADGSWIARKYAFVTAQFGVAPYSYDDSGPYGEPWTTITFGSAGESQTLPDTVYKFSNGTPTQTPVGLLIPSTEITIKRFKMPYSPLEQVTALVGKVNLTPVTLVDTTFDAGTLLFLGGNDEIGIDSIGNVTIDVEYRMSFRPINWNFYLHPNGTTGFALVTDGNSNPVYGAGEFNDLP